MFSFFYAVLRHITSHFYHVLGNVKNKEYTNLLIEQEVCISMSYRWE